MYIMKKRKVKKMNKNKVTENNGVKMYLKDLHEEWLSEIWLKNEGLQRIVYDIQEEQNNEYVFDIIQELRFNNAIDYYNISLYENGYIKVEDKYQYLENLKQVLDDYGLGLEAGELGILQVEISDCIDLITAYNSVSQYRSLYDELEERIDKKIELINDTVIARLQKLLEEDDKHAFEMFIDIIKHEYHDDFRIFDNVYIRGGEGFTAYEDITKDYSK
jgi:hypothetical protein